MHFEMLRPQNGSVHLRPAHHLHGDILHLRIEGRTLLDPSYLTLIVKDRLSWGLFLEMLIMVEL
jgi:hypothetical protein